MFQKNQYNESKQNLEKKNVVVENKIPDISGWVTTTVCDTEIGKVENKIPDVTGLVRKQIKTLK